MAFGGETSIVKNLKEIFDAFVRELDVPWMMSNVEKLWKIEFGQCFRDHRRSARFVERLLRQSRFEQVERIAFPADGRTTFQDKTMPLAWDASVGRLTVKKARAPFDDPVVADYRRHPFHLIRGSVSTPKGGVVTRLISEEQMYVGQDARGAMVVTAPETRASSVFVRSACDLGALGFVTDHSAYRYKVPDGIGWVNACTEGAQWHVQDDDRPFVGFSVSPRVGDRLREAVRAGEVLVHVESDGRRHEGEIDVVTAVVPGRDRRELWLLSHLYEPLPNDNSSGSVAAIEIGRALQRLIAAGDLPRPRFTLRVVFGLEMYGFASYAHLRGGNLRRKVLGAINMDGISVGPRPGKVLLAPAGTPFFGDYLLEELSRDCRGEPGLSLGTIVEREGYHDDLFLSDPTVGMPTVWPHGSSGLWHNSEQKMDIITPECYRKATAFNAAWATAMLTLEGDALDARVRAAAALAVEHLDREATTVLRKAAGTDELLALAPQISKAMAWRRKWEEGRMAGLARLGNRASSREALASVKAAGRRAEADLKRSLHETEVVPRRSGKTSDSPWERAAAAMVPRRATVGFPHDLHRVARDRRRKLPGSVIYGPFGHVMARMDGRKTLRELIQEAAWESGKAIGPADVREYVGAVEFLTEHGYLKTRYRHVVRRRDVVSALRRAGLKAGDLAFVHSRMSVLGHVVGGPDAVIDACLDVLGPEGTLLMPAFTCSEIFVAGRQWMQTAFRPFGLKNCRPWVGRIPTRFLERKGVLRSAHPTHSVAGAGPLADACLREHRENDAPCCRRSPLGQLLDGDGKILWIGASLGTTTFFHLLEDELRLPYLQDALCAVERADGTRATVGVPRYPTGHRDFYGPRAEESKIFRRLIEDGLAVRRARLGFGAVKLISAPRLHELGMAALRDDPNLLLCDNPDCPFCSRQGSFGSSAQ